MIYTLDTQQYINRYFIFNTIYIHKVQRYQYKIYTIRFVRLF